MNLLSFRKDLFISGVIKEDYKSFSYQLLSEVSIIFAIALSIVSMAPWFIWGISFHALFATLFMLARIPLFPRKYNRDISPILFWFICYAFLFSRILVNPINEVLQCLIGILLPIFFVLFFKTGERKLYIKGVVNIFTLMTIVALIAFFIKVFIVELPYSEIENSNPFYPKFKNYFFFILLYDFGIFSRFQGMLTEPGHMGMYCAILLYITGYSLKKWQNIVLTIGLLWSFSLAGYMLYVVGLLIQKVALSHNRIKTIFKIIISVILLSCAGIAFYSPSNDDMLSIAILSRLAIDDKKGVSGNNRNTASFKLEYEKFISSSDALVGYSTKKYNRLFKGSANSSYQVFVMINGLGAVICLIGFIFSNNYVYPSFLGLGFSVFLLISFLQRPYFMSEAQSFTFLCFVPLCWKYGMNALNISG